MASLLEAISEEVLRDHVAESMVFSGRNGGNGTDKGGLGQQGEHSNLGEPTLASTHFLGLDKLSIPKPQGSGQE